MRRLIIISLLAALAASLSCGRKERSLNVVLIGIDTLRRDHVGCYGYERPTTPKIDQWAAGGVVFEDAVSQAPWTLPSFTTIHTSLYPTQHGAGGFERAQGTYGNRMGGTVLPLAMVLLKKGYSTGAIVNAPALAPDFGVDKGFEFYDLSRPWNPRLADGTTEDALGWIDQHIDEPFFMFVHYFDPHLPYSPPEPYDTMYDPDYEGRISKTFDRDDFNHVISEIGTEDVARAEIEWNHVRALYDGEIAFTDREVGKLLDGLEDRGLVDNTLVVLVADHGEEFFDHGGFEHGHTMFEEMIKVPLIFYLPGRIPEGKRVGRQVRLLDVMPTILDFVGVESPTGLEGASLKPLILGEGDVTERAGALLPSRFSYSEFMLYGAEKKCVTAYPWKVIYNMGTGSTMMFNLEADPGEMNDLAASEPEAGVLLEEVLSQTLLNISDTWYVEFAAGDADHVFDLEIALSDRSRAGRIVYQRLVDAGGRVFGEDLVSLNEVSRRDLRLSGIKLGTRLLLAFKVTPRVIPVTFNLKIDGRPATDRTFLGADLLPAGSMPFESAGKRNSTVNGVSTRRPDAPYFYIWYAGAKVQEETPVALSDETRKQLKALGYIQ